MRSEMCALEGDGRTTVTKGKCDDDRTDSPRVGQRANLRPMVMCGLFIRKRQRHEVLDDGSLDERKTGINRPIWGYLVARAAG